MFYNYRPVKYIYLLFFIILLSEACTVVKNYPINKPFVYKNNIVVTGVIVKDEKKRLALDLINYWDDSLKVLPFNKLKLFNFKKNTPFIYNMVIDKPPVYDTASVTRTVYYMSSYLNSQGYYNFDIKLDTVIVDSVKNSPQKRATVQMAININNGLSIDSVSFDSIQNSILRSIALQHSNATLLIKKKPFSNTLISSELDRLVNLYHRNGFYNLTRENLYAEVDTIDAALLEVSLDPFEQAQKIAEAALRRKTNPTIDVSIKLRPVADTLSLQQFYNGRVYFYPDTTFVRNIENEAVIAFPFTQTLSHGSLLIKQNKTFVKLSPFIQHNYIESGKLYDEQNYIKTLNAFSTLGPWSQVDSKLVPRIDSPSVLDYHFIMIPAKKYSFGYDLEASRNSGSIISGNLLGISNVLTLRNRNVWKRAIQSSTVIRGGVELGFGDTVLQTFQVSLAQTYSFPKLMTPWKIKNTNTLDDYNTILSLKGSYTDRRNFFRLRSAIVSFGYDWKKKNRVWVLRPANIELYSLDTLNGLKSAFVTNPFLRTAFNTGYVVGENATFTLSWPNKKHPNTINNFRVSAEESGGLVGTLSKGIKDKVYQFVKFESEFKKAVQWRKTSIGFRAFGGIGINYSNDPVLGKSLPFFKQFVAGGPYSMRAWGIRQLGLGSSLLSDTNTTFRDRFGDIQLETNFEYRFSLFQIGSMKVKSALFVDMGNIWNLKVDVDNPGSKLALNNLWKDIAIAAGFGLLRLDFDYFLIRLDFAYKVKDPARISNGGWMSIKDFEWRNNEFDVKDGSGRRLVRNNYSLQLGIGLPF